MNEIVYVKAIAQGKIASGQILVKLVAQNTDGFPLFYTDEKDLFRPNADWNISAETQKKHIDFHKKYSGVKNAREASKYKGSKGV